MRMKLRITFILFFLAAIATYSVASAATPSTNNNFITSSSILNNWIVIVAEGVIASFMIVSVYYMIGYLFNRSSIKAAATSELGKLIGILIVSMVILGVFYSFGASLLFTNAAGQAQIATLCNQLQNSRINFISTNSLVPSPSPSSTICTDIIDPKAGTNIGQATRYIDYGLSSVYIIEDNLTNQSAQSLNSVYIFSTMLGFLRKYSITDSVCFPAPPCLIPGELFQTGVELSSTPYAGYQIGNTLPNVIGTEANVIFYFFLFQLILILLMLLIWPYLLAAGLLLETNMFTRRLGGLLIAIVISSMLVYPTVFLFEYSSLNNLQNVQPYGASSIPSLALCGAPAGGTPLGKTPLLNGQQASGVYCYTDAKELPLSYIYKATLPDTFTDMVPNNYKSYSPNLLVPACPNKNAQGLCFFQKNLNFFVMPKIKDILNLYFTWPAGGSLLSFEAPFVVPATALVKNVVDAIASLTSLLSGNFIGSFPSSILDYYVDPAHTVAAILALINVYAIDAVVGFILPVLNVLILISSILEISRLLGGERTILGLEKFV